jgi:hypothetical protein
MTFFTKQEGVVVVLLSFHNTSRFECEPTSFTNLQNFHRCHMMLIQGNPRGRWEGALHKCDYERKAKFKNDLITCTPLDKHQVAHIRSLHTEVVLRMICCFCGYISTLYSLRFHIGSHLGQRHGHQSTILTSLFL